MREDMKALDGCPRDHDLRVCAPFDTWADMS
jgi:hypothetical protein